MVGHVPVDHVLGCPAVLVAHYFLTYVTLWYFIPVSSFFNSPLQLYPPPMTACPRCDIVTLLPHYLTQQP